MDGLIPLSLLIPALYDISVRRPTDLPSGYLQTLPRDNALAIGFIEIGPRLRWIAEPFASRERKNCAPSASEKNEI